MYASLHSGTPRECSCGWGRGTLIRAHDTHGNIQHYTAEIRTVRTHSVHIMDSFSSHYGHIQFTLWTHSVHIMDSFSSHYGHIQFTLWTHAVHIMNTFSSIHYSKYRCQQKQQQQNFRPTNLIALTANKNTTNANLNWGGGGESWGGGGGIFTKSYQKNERKQH